MPVMYIEEKIYEDEIKIIFSSERKTITIHSKKRNNHSKII